MKQFLLLFSFIIITFSCSSDDNSESSTNHLIEGKWKYYKYEFAGDEDYEPFSDVANNSCGYWHIREFTNSGIMYFKEFGDNCILVSEESSNYSVDGSNLIYHNVEYDVHIGQ